MNRSGFSSTRGFEESTAAAGLAAGGGVSGAASVFTAGLGVGAADLGTAGGVEVFGTGVLGTAAAPDATFGAAFVVLDLVVVVFAGGFVGAECFAALEAADLELALVEAAFGATTFAAGVAFDVAVLDAYRTSTCPSSAFRGLVMAVERVAVRHNAPYWGSR